MNGEQNLNSRVQFDSSDIGKKENPDYFEGRIKKSPVKNFIKYQFAGKNKFIIISIVTAIVIAIAVLVLWLTVWSQSSTDTGNINNEDNWSEQLAGAEGRANVIFNSDSENSFMEAIAYFDAMIEEAEDKNRIFDLKLAKAAFLNNNGGAQMTIDELSAIDESSLTDDQQYRLYLSLAFAYRQNGDEEYAQIYDEKINALPSSATTIGG